MTKTFSDWLTQKNMQQRFECWMVSFGVVKKQQSHAGEVKGRCGFVNKEKLFCDLEKDIKHKIDQGVTGRSSIYNALLKEGKIPSYLGGPITLQSFGVHFTRATKNYTRLLSTDKTRISETKKSRKILDLFDSGVSEVDIFKYHGFARSHIYTVLIRYGRTKKRDLGNRIDKGSLKLTRITEMLIAGIDKHRIVEQTGSTLKYVDELIRWRNNAFKFLGNGSAKNALELCQLIPLSKVHAESLIREFYDNQNNVEKAAKWLV